MFARIALVTLFSALALLGRPSAAEACDSAVRNDLFTMADSAERVLVVHATGNGKARVGQTLKGSASDPLPPILSNCDPHLEEGADYVLFIRPGGQYYTDTSAVRLIGERGQDWISIVRDWIARKDDALRSDILKKTLDREFASLPLYTSDWRMLEDIANLPMPHPTIDRARERRLKSELSVRKTCSTPNTFSWFRQARAAHAILLVRPNKGSRVSVLETLRGQRVPKTIAMKGFPIAWGADYLITINSKGEVTQPALLVADAKGQRVVSHVKTWAKTGMKPAGLRGLALQLLSAGYLCDNEVSRLAYDALWELSTTSMSRRDCRAFDYQRRSGMAQTLSAAVDAACRRPQKKR